MKDELRVGIIGFDTSHVPAFSDLLNNEKSPYHVSGAKVTAGFPSYSPDLHASYSRVEGYKQEMVSRWGIRLVGSVEELLEEVDAVLLESVDGRRHLAEAKPVLLARKPVFIDKPLAAGYADAAAIFRLAQEYDCPVFSSSSLRFDVNLTAILNDPELGEVLGCDAFSPAHLDPTNPGMFWYGIHGVEILYTFMGTDCQSVTCYVNENDHVLVGRWKDGRTGTMRGTRSKAGDYGATVFGSGKLCHATYNKEIPLYYPLMKKIVDFFHGAPPPVSTEETLELMRFIQAALVSENEGSRPVSLSEI